MQNDDNKATKEKESRDKNLPHKDDLTEAVKIHEAVVSLGYDYVLEKLRSCGFSDAESLAEKILANDPATPEMKKNKKMEDLRKKLADIFDNKK